MASQVSPRSTRAYEHVLEHLRAKRVRITEIRKAIIAYMVDSKEHPSAEKIYKDLLPLYPSMSLATVYNNLKVLVDEGFVEEIKITNDSTTYYDFMGHDHINIVCESCGKIVDFMDVELLDISKEAYEQTQFKITKLQLLAYGICPECQKKQENHR
ncbi:peroxide-responsive transcriptional repressor PerR [Streptococcus hyointestinalis]|uniref:peroxide-responsive transcriptional repressor PerR n=1 Tax=Streptococcus hyointestinalis TaxID=1337 RepID=UPI0013E07C35|nr:peroxide-responsive transcriptional repressor PerR [Streptococcus hyointestinalis]